MNKLLSIASLAALAVSAPALAQETEKTEFPSPNAIVDAAPASDWVKMAPSDLLVMDLAPGAEGNARRVVIQLMPEPFSQGWIRNIRKLAEAKFWDGTSINRVQDNYVVQWGDAGYDNPESGETEQKALPDGLETVPESEYLSKLTPIDGESSNIDNSDPASDAKEGYRDDAYGTALFGLGWPLGSGNNSLWPIHCYGAVGVGRNYSPDTGSGAELYTVIGHAPRHLDRNIAVVGRIIEGIEYLSSLPRGKGQLGFYEDASKRVPISSIRLGDALDEDPAPAFEYLNTESKVFAKYADARANRRDPFFIKPAGGADICNIPVPVRRVSGE
ncbi:peptidylprolyl isomerase [uncultured Parasphingorhabdus sp.]|uniref:peptidylprolyl isomerase n=1 Tax=uncultured Parasphingorhabdus sp. TaxID=2709694 RepID=UPI0030D786C8|tara:strand:+ start:15216 stop:16205 length:990 start_codon:yes stop_codon:yes gene_type:complete